MNPQPAQQPPYERLKTFLKAADYDAALAMVSKADSRTLIQAPDDLSVLRFRCMASDVWDYGGKYGEAKAVLGEGNTNVGLLAERELKNVHDIHDIRAERQYLAKQQCWAILLWGMTYYRQGDFDSALTKFEMARKVAEVLHNSPKFRSVGTLARAWYCVGLVHREQRESKQSRAAFREALNFTHRGIQEREAAGHSTTSFEFNLARCAGLGLGWIAYNEASLTEADAMLVMARRMMKPAKARLIGAYLDTLQAMIMMSGSALPLVIKDALRILDGAYKTFAPAGSLEHEHYALRCRNEIALTHLRLACARESVRRSSLDVAKTALLDTIDDAKEPDTNDEIDREQHLNKASVHVDELKKAAKKLGPIGSRTFCAALITEARIMRERGEPQKALDLLSQDAADVDSKFIRVDACIGIGEAYVALGAYKPAIESFLKALKSCKGNRKDVAVCNLHLCRAYLLDNQPLPANERFKVWESMQDGVENAFIRSLASVARRELSLAIQDFRLTREDIERDGNHRKRLNELRQWLVTTASAIKGADTAAATHLGITSETLRLWRQGKFPRDH